MEIIWTRLAENDLGATIDYLALKNPRAARQLSDSVFAAVDQLADLPHRGRPGRRENTRELVITGAPYVVIYRVTDTTIAILRVLHQAQQWPEE